MMKPARLALLTAISLCATLTAADNRSWEFLSMSLKHGTKVQVVEKNMAAHVGKLAAIDKNGITLTTGTGPDKTIARAEIVRVSNAGQRGRHALWGLAIGAVGGIGVGYGAAYSGGDASGAGAAQGIAYGMLLTGIIGAGIGAALPANGTLYRAPAGMNAAAAAKPGSRQPARRSAGVTR